MTFYEDIVNQTQMTFSMYQHVYAMGSTPIKLTEKEALPYGEQIKSFAKQVKEAECIVIGGASGLSAAGGGDFYYEDNESYRKYFGNMLKNTVLKVLLQAQQPDGIPVRNSGNIL